LRLSFRNIDETRDIFTFDLSHTIANTDVLLGMRYEHDENDYSFNMIRGAGQLPPLVAPPGQQRFVTQHQNDDIDLFSGHAIAVTRFDDSFWFTAAIPTPLCKTTWLGLASLEPLSTPPSASQCRR
jgi:hypothetical protein